MKLSVGHKVRSFFSPHFLFTKTTKHILIYYINRKKVQEVEQSPEEGAKTRLKAAGAGTVSCRLCKGEHYTAKCPYKDTLGNLENNGI